MYAQIAHYYDLTHAALTEDIVFVRQAAAAVAGPILELGVGNGRLALPLAVAGHRVVGLDNSAPMLAIAQRKLVAADPAVHQRVELHEVDITSFYLNTQFELILLPYNTDLHLDAQQLAACLHCVRHHLSPNGRFLLDSANPHDFFGLEENSLNTLEEEGRFFDPRAGEEVTVFTGVALDAAAQIATIRWLYRPARSAELEVTETFHLRYPHELLLLVEEAGLAVEAVWGDYAQRPFNVSSDRLLLSCRLD